MLNYIFWEITHRCNQRCRICPLYGVNNKSELCGELTTKENMIILEKIAHCFPESPPKIKISGGEPMMRRDIFTLLAYIEQLGMPYGLMTNFSLLDGESVNHLLELNPKFINVSLDGDEVVHEKLRNASGSYQKTLANLTYYTKYCRDVSIELNCVIQPENLSILRHIVDVAAALGVKATFQHINFFSDKECERQRQYDKKNFGVAYTHYINKTNYFQSLEKILDIHDRLEDVLNYGKEKGVEVKIKPNIYEVNMLTSYYLGDTDFVSYNCPELGKMIFIQPDGTVNACFECYPVGNLLTDYLEDILQGDYYKNTVSILNSNEKVNPICARCCKNPF